MKHYLSPTGELYAYDDDGSQDHIIPADFVLATAAQIKAVQDPDPTPAQLLERALEAVNQSRDAALAAPFVHNGIAYPSDTVFQAQLQSSLLAWSLGILPPGATAMVRREDNTTVQMGQADLTTLAAGLMVHIQTIYAISWAQKDAIRAGAAT